MDESGASLKPPVSSTWAPRGCTPLIEYNFNWKKLSTAGFLCYRADNRAHDVFFQIRAGSYASEEVIEALKAFKKQMGRRRCVLVWDMLPAHRSRQVKEYLEGQRSWLQIEWLPGYAPELNPVEQVWSNVKGGELANFCAREIKDLEAALQAGLRRVSRSNLPKSFLRHAGLFL